MLRLLVELIELLLEFECTTIQDLPERFFFVSKQPTCLKLNQGFQLSFETTFIKNFKQET